jgi:hypothetical protein
MHISTLRDFIQAMGGELELIAQFPDRPPVRLEALGTASLRRTHPRAMRSGKSRSSPAASTRRSPG